MLQSLIITQFQHTAARRRLLPFLIGREFKHGVSTHSRAEAAAKRAEKCGQIDLVSTHSRAEAAAPYLKKQEKSAD